MGRLPNDDQSQRALGLDISDWALCMFRGAAGNGSQQRCYSAASRNPTSATSGKSVRQSSRHWKALRPSQDSGATSKSAEAKKAADKDSCRCRQTTPTLIPPSVANANAQLTSADASGDSASAMTAKASTMLLAAADKPAEAQAPAEAAVVASDQLNDVDRALHQSRLPRRPSRWPPPGRRLRAVQASAQRQFDLGSDLDDRQDLHRFRRLADDGFRRTHVHGVAAAVPDAQAWRPVRGLAPLEAHPAQQAHCPRNQAPGWIMATFEYIIVESKGRSASSR